MTNLEFINKEIKETQNSYRSFDLDYKLFHRESDKRDANKLMKKLIHLQQIKTELEVLELIKNHEFEIDRLDSVAEYWVAHIWKPFKSEEINIIKKGLEMNND